MPYAIWPCAVKAPESARIAEFWLARQRDDPPEGKYHRALLVTFISGAATQEAAAERLSLPFSTYRRHLGRGLESLGTLLWKAETHGLSLLDQAAHR